MFILKVFLFVVVLAGLIAWIASYISKKGGIDRVEVKGIVPRVITALAVLFGVVILLGAIGQIPTGSRGIVLRFGSVTGRTLGEGIYVITPLMEDVQQMDVRTVAFVAEADAASKDLQNVHTKITVNYSLDPTKVGEIYRSLGTEYEARIIVPAIQEAVKSSTAQYDAEKLIVERPAVKSSVETSLRGRLASHGFLLDTVSITGFNFSKEFNESIERKVTATQNALTEQNNLQAVKFKSDQAIAQATGEAQAIKLKAEALRESPQVLQLNAIQKWDGKLPMYNGGGPLPFLAVK